MTAPGLVNANVTHTPEKRGFGMSGGAMFAVTAAMFLVAGASLLGAFGFGIAWLLGVAVVVGLLALLFVRGFFVLQPNEAEVITLFGRYTGTVREAGWYWTNPFTSRKSISLRVHNFNTPQLKVNDGGGNPIEIGAVVVWRVVDTARASFDVENYGQFVQVQSETAVRHIANKYPYDITDEPGQPTLRGGSTVIRELQIELQSRLELAGIEVLDSRITHLAYSPEIAGAMLQRQQASAILAARRLIVQGAVGMVEDVITSLDQRGVLRGMDVGHRADMASALLVVLTSDRGAQPVVQTG